MTIDCKTKYDIVRPTESSNATPPHNSMITPAIAPMTAPPASKMLSRPAFETGNAEELGAEVAAPAERTGVIVEADVGEADDVAELAGGVDVAPAPTS